MTVTSTAVAIVASELTVRFVDGYALTSVALKATPGAAASQSNPIRGDALRYAAETRSAPDLDLSWFKEEPAPSPNRTLPNPYFKDVMSTGFDYATNVDPFNLWNLQFVRANPDNFKNFPGFIFVFVPHDASPRPPFLLFPNSTTPAGLVTNRFAFRGHPIALKKPAGVIRIAFLGASATLGQPKYPFSYPELVEFWLNRWAETKKLAVRFEAINAGRWSVGSSDIAKIFTDEVLPLEPDIAIYYEGGLQFDLSSLISPRSQSQPAQSPPRADLKSRLYAKLRTSSAIWRRIGGRVAGGLLREGPRPDYALRWPADVDEHEPDIGSPNLPVNLPVILGDLDAIHSAAQTANVQMIVSSFKWLVFDGMTLDPGSHNNIHEFLEQYPWRYRDMRRLADFQSRVLKRYAEKRGVGFLDIDRLFPNSPDLFNDSVHKAYAGEKIHAWIVVNRLIPQIAKQIDEGTLPRKAVHPLAEHPMDAIKVARIPIPSLADRCSEDDARRMVDLKSLSPAYKLASIEAGDVVTIRTGPEQWLYAAEAPVPTDPSPDRERLSVSIEYRVMTGRVGFGILTPDKARYVVQKLGEDGPDRRLSLSFAPIRDAAGKNPWLNIYNASEAGPSVVQIRSIDMCYKKSLPLEPIGHGTFGGLAAELAGTSP